jgi:uncharacterized protein YbjT (DUF2867 family)
MKVVVTGGTGVPGQPVLRPLLEHRRQVRAEAPRLASSGKLSPWCSQSDHGGSPRRSHGGR